jgi:hypothetical protein
VLQPLRAADVDLDAFLEPGPFVDIIGEARYLTWAPPAAYYQRGYLSAQEPSDWPALALERGTLFGVRDVLGYNPVQLQRYWRWIRTINELPLFYNATSVQVPTARDVDVMGLRYLIVPEGLPSPVPGTVVATDRGYDLVELADAAPLVSVVPTWRSVHEDEAFDAIASTDFRVGSLALVEGRPPFEPASAAPGSAGYREVSATDVRIAVEADGPSIVVVRTTYDDGWSATVDGEPAPVLPTDGFLQGVPVGAGAHEIRLVYQDPAVATGLWLSAGAWLTLAAAWVVAWRRDRRRFRTVDERSEVREAPAAAEV